MGYKVKNQNVERENDILNRLALEGLSIVLPDDIDNIISLDNENIIKDSNNKDKKKDKKTVSKKK